MVSQVGLVGSAAFGATKATLASMTRSWAAEFGNFGVRVNTIAPGPVFTGGAAPDRIEALGARLFSLGQRSPARLQRSSPFWHLPNSSYVTGAVVAADAGRTAV